MTLLTPPAYEQGGTYTALLDRQYQVTTTTMRDFSVSHRARQGAYSTRFPAFSNPSGMNVVVGPCAGVVTNTFATDAGDYRYANPSNFQVTLAGSSPTLNRNDIIGVQVKDNFYDGSGLVTVVPAVVQGTGSAGTPSDPTLPNTFLGMVRGVVNANVTSPTLQAICPKIVMDGGVLPIGSDTDRAALGTPNAGFVIWRTDKKAFEIFNGSSWDLAGAVQPIRAQLRQTAAHSLANAVYTSIQFQNEDSDTANGHDTVTNNTRYTAQVAGTYEFDGAVVFASSTAGQRAVRWRKNGATTALDASQTSCNPVTDPAAVTTLAARGIQIALAVNDYVELQAYQNTGGALNTFSGTTGAFNNEAQSSMSVKYLGP